MSIINIFGWHSHFGENSRPSAMKAFVDPIKKYYNVRTIPLGQTSYINFNYNELKGQPIVFWAMHPPESVLNDKDYNITWVPMFDDVMWKRKSFWKSFPKHLKIIAYSKWIKDITIKLKLNTIRVKYFENPNNLKQAYWNKGNNLFYWNRSGLLNKYQLRRLCDSLDIKTLVFRDQLDYYAHKKQKIILDDRLGNTDVLHLDMQLKHIDYMEYLSNCNIFITPRLYEGIGLTFIEAMASGMVVFSPNYPTMNEYIENNYNGIYLPFIALRRHYNRSVTKLSNINGFNLPIISILPKKYNFDKLKSLSLQEIGNNARNTQQEGYFKWIEIVPKIIDFILSNSKSSIL